jgi:magnesium transporter
MAYDSDRLRQLDHIPAEECARFRKEPGVTWLNVSGVNDVRMIEQLGGAFDIHPLVFEDIV